MRVCVCGCMCVFVCVGACRVYLRANHNESGVVLRKGFIIYGHTLLHFGAYTYASVR